MTRKHYPQPDIRATVLPDGDLLITANNSARADLADACRRGYYEAEETVFDYLHPGGIEFVRPEDVGALTDSPILADDAVPDDDGVMQVYGAVWWFPDHQIIDPWRELANKGVVRFARGEEA